MRQADVAALINVSESWLEKRRSKGDGGPPFHKFGRMVRYYRPEVEKWYADRRIEN